MILKIDQKILSWDWREKNCYLISNIYCDYNSEIVLDIFVSVNLGRIYSLLGAFTAFWKHLVHKQGITCLAFLEREEVKIYIKIFHPHDDRYTCYLANAI